MPLLQGLRRGKLEGDELRRIVERAPILFDMFEKHLEFPTMPEILRLGIETRDAVSAISEGDDLLDVAEPVVEPFSWGRLLLVLGLGLVVASIILNVGKVR